MATFHVPGSKLCITLIGLFSTLHGESTVSVVSLTRSSCVASKVEMHCQSGLNVGVAPATASKHSQSVNELSSAAY